MTHTQLYNTWGLLIAMLFGLTGVARTVELLRDEIEEFRQYMMSEKRDKEDF